MVIVFPVCFMPLAPILMRTRDIKVVLRIQLSHALLLLSNIHMNESGVIMQPQSSSPDLNQFSSHSLSIHDFPWNLMTTDSVSV